MWSQKKLSVLKLIDPVLEQSRARQSSRWTGRPPAAVPITNSDSPAAQKLVTGGVYTIVADSSE